MVSFAFGDLSVFSGAGDEITDDVDDIASGALSGTGEGVDGSVALVSCLVNVGGAGVVEESFSLFSPHADNISKAMAITKVDCFIIYPILVDVIIPRFWDLCPFNYPAVKQPF